MSSPTKNLQYFNQHITPKIPPHYHLEWSNFGEGSFGDLRRLEFESPKYLGTVDFWSRDWVAIDLVDIGEGEEILNVLFSPDEDRDIRQCFHRLLELMSYD